MKFAFIDVEKAKHPVSRLCRVMEVSRSGYYAWTKRGESARARSDRALLDEVREVFHESHRLYGWPRVHAALKARGRRVSGKRVARLMRENGLEARRRKPYRKSRKAAHFPMAPNLLDRRFSDVTAPGDVWVGDVTYIRTGEGWLYLAVVLDVCSRKVIGWSTAPVLDGGLPVEAFRRAVAQAGAGPRMFHSDRGSEYACLAFRSALAEHDVERSMSRPGDCWDNAVAESFFATFKRELVHLSKFSTRSAAHLATFEYIEAFYNRARLHSALGYQTPVAFEAAA